MRRKACPFTGKRIYGTRELAQKNLEVQEKHQPAISLRVYVCEFCRHWHLTHHRRNRW